MCVYVFRKYEPKMSDFRTGWSAVHTVQVCKCEQFDGVNVFSMALIQVVVRRAL